MNIHQLRIAIAEAIEGSKFAGKAYFAGGCVRDLLIHRQSEDFDVTIELPEGGIKLASFLHKALSTSEPVTFPRFGTASLIYQGTKIELVMTRKEEYRTGNRNPKVSFASLEEDVLRRDFTINSLLLGISSGALLDLSKRGLRDLQEGTVRTLGKADDVFSEDPLRMLRAIRFATMLDFKIEAETWAALKSKAALVQTLSQSRITSEFAGIMVPSPNPHSRNRNEPEGAAVARGFGLLLDSGIMDHIQPEQQQRLEILSEKRFSLTPQELIGYFGYLENSRLGIMMKSAKEYWFENPEATHSAILRHLKEQKL